MRLCRGTLETGQRPEEGSSEQQAVRSRVTRASGFSLLPRSNCGRGRRRSLCQELAPVLPLPSELQNGRPSLRPASAARAASAAGGSGGIALAQLHVGVRGFAIKLGAGIVEGVGDVTRGVTGRGVSAVRGGAAVPSCPAGGGWGLAGACALLDGCGGEVVAVPGLAVGRS